MIVDDDPRNICILEELLCDDYSISTAENGEQALSIIDEVQPDILLLDIMMPGIDGYEVCSRVKASEATMNIKVILVSGKAMPEERIRGYESGADDFVIKPFDIDELSAKINVFAKLKSMEEVTKLKSDFLSLISHEVGTPLNHIIGLSDLLVRQGDLNTATREAVVDMGDAAHSLSQTVNNILFLAKLKQEKLSDYIEMDARNLVLDIIQLLGDPPSELDIKFEISNTLRITGNFELIEKLFVNLFSSTMNTAEGTVLCRVQPKDKASQPGVEFAIEYKAEQLDEKQMDKFFDPFYIEDIMAHSQGTNIIMGICQQIVAMHRGDISIRNMTEGLCITVWLPENRPALT